MPIINCRPRVLRQRLVLCGLGAVLAAAVIAAPEAHATPQQDQAYLSTLDHYAIPYTSETAAINAGHSICQAFDAGATFMDMVRAGIRVGFTSTQIAHEIGASIGSFCPEHQDVLGTAAPSQVWAS